MRFKLNYKGSCRWLTALTRFQILRLPTTLMAIPKPSPRILNRSFDRSTSPVYLVNVDFEITYANPACGQWCETELEQIVGVQLFFQVKLRTRLKTRSTDSARRHHTSNHKTRRHLPLGRSQPLRSMRIIKQAGNQPGLFN